MFVTRRERTPPKWKKIDSEVFPLGSKPADPLSSFKARPGQPKTANREFRKLFIPPNKPKSAFFSVARNARNESAKKLHRSGPGGLARDKEPAPDFEGRCNIYLPREICLYDLGARKNSWSNSSTRGSPVPAPSRAGSSFSGPRTDRSLLPDSAQVNINIYNNYSHDRASRRSSPGTQRHPLRSRSPGLSLANTHDIQNTPSRRHLDFSLLLSEVITTRAAFSFLDLFLEERSSRKPDLKEIFDQVQILFKDILTAQAILEVPRQPLPAIRLPPRASHLPLTLVIDLDETLVHSEPAVPGKVYDHEIPLSRGNIGVQVRPYLRTFFESIRDCYELIIYTASGEIYAEKVRELIDPDDRYFLHLLSRRQCIKVNDIFVKTIDIFANRDPKTVLILDNAFYAFAYNYVNQLLVKPYLGGKDDTELLKILLFLQTCLADCKDVPAFLSRKLQYGRLVASKSLKELSLVIKEMFFPN